MEWSFSGFSHSLALHPTGAAVTAHASHHLRPLPPSPAHGPRPPRPWVSLGSFGGSMKPFLKVKVLTDDNGELHYLLQASNGSSATAQEFYGYREDWKEFAAKLRTFPKSPTDEVRFELGEDDEKWAYYLLLRAFCFDSLGHSALEVFAVSPSTPPHGYRDRFFIIAEPSALNRLGETLAGWDAREGSEIEWRL